MQFLLSASPFVLTLVSVTIVSLISFAGVFMFFFSRRLIERALLLFVSFAAGAILGDVFLHIVPELIEEVSTDLIMPWILVGIVVSFFIEKIIHWHHCHLLPEENHDHDHHDHHHHHHHHVGTMSLVGDALHNVLDGILIAGSFMQSTPLGIAATIAVCLHEIPQEISDTALLLYSGYSRGKALLFNFLTACTAILGGVLMFAFSDFIGSFNTVILAFTAGNFIYIAGTDLIPELHRETRIMHALMQLLCFVIGIGFMFALTFLE